MKSIRISIFVAVLVATAGYIHAQNTIPPIIRQEQNTTKPNVQQQGTQGSTTQAPQVSRPNPLDKYERYAFFNDMTISRARLKSTGKWGIIDKQGKELVPFSYDEVYDASAYSYRLDKNYKQGLLLLMKKDGKFGLVDKNGKEIVPFIYEEAESDYYEEYREEGIMRVTRNGKKGYIDTYGNVIIACMYDEASPPDEGLVRVKLNDKWGFFEYTGKQVTPLIYDDARHGKGFVCVKLNNKWGFLDKTGKEITPIIYLSLDYFLDEGMAGVRCEDGKWGFIDLSGRLVIPCIYDDAYSFHNGLSTVRYNGKFGIIDKNGKEVVPLVYDGISSHHQPEYTPVSKDGKWGAVNRAGKEIVPCIYDVVIDDIPDIILVGKDTGENKYSFNHSGPCNFIFGCWDKDGKEIIPCIYTYVEGGRLRPPFPYLTRELAEKYIVVGKGKGGVVTNRFGGRGSFCMSVAETYGVINKQGNEVIPCIYERNVLIEKLKTLK